MSKLRTLLIVCVLSVFALGASLSFAQRGRGSFGGGSHFGGGGSFGSHSSFGGGGFSRSGGGSFGSHSSFGSSTGGSFSRSGSSSFSRSGSFGHSGSVTSTSISRPSYFGSRPTYIRTYGTGYHAYYYGGWSDYSFYWGHPAWYYWLPFHPAFYYGPPVYYGGGYYPGEFMWSRLLISILVFIFIIWLISLLFRGGRGGGGRRLKYTSYE